MTAFVPTMAVAMNAPPPFFALKKMWPGAAAEAADGGAAPRADGPDALGERGLAILAARRRFGEIPDLELEAELGKEPVQHADRVDAVAVPVGVVMVADGVEGAAVVHEIDDRLFLGRGVGRIGLGEHDDGGPAQDVGSERLDALHGAAGALEGVGEIGKASIDGPVGIAGGLGMAFVEQHQRPGERGRGDAGGQHEAQKRSQSCRDDHTRSFSTFSHQSRAIGVEKG